MSKKINQIVKSIAVVIVSLIYFAALFKIVNIAIVRSEVSRCQELQQDSKKYPRFFLARWEDEMCKAHNIIIDAPVGDSQHYVSSH